MDAIVQPPRGIVAALELHARVRPDALALTYLADGVGVERSLSFAEIEYRARQLAAEILRTAPDAKRIMVLQAPGIDFVISLCACFMAGVAAVPTPPPAVRATSNSAQRFARLLADAAPDAIVTHSELLARVRWLVQGQIGLPPQNWVISDACFFDDDAMPLPVPASRDLALIQYTSGSTAEPKGVRIDHGNLAANLSAIQAKFELTSDSVVVSWLPPYHDMGLIGGIIEALWCGYRVILLDAQHFVKRPLSWLEAIDRYHADVSGGANFAYDLCVDALAHVESLELNLSRWRLAFSGAEPVRASTIDRFSVAFARYGFRRSVFYPCYGLAEATLMAAGPDPGTPRPIILSAMPGAEKGASQPLVSCGTPCPGTAIEIVDAATGLSLPEGQAGEIRISGPAVTRGYWHEPDGNGDKPLATGDIGFIWQGELYVTGRLKDLIIVRGRNLAPGDVEDAIVMCHPVLAPAAAAAFSVDTDDGEGFVVAAEIRREHRLNADWPSVFAAMQSRISEQVGGTPVDIVLLRPGSLPRTTSGKIRRQACRQSYMDDTWEPLARRSGQAGGDLGVWVGARQRMADAGREERLATLDEYLVWRLAQLTSTPETFLTPDTPIDGIGLDSLKQVEFALLVEKDLGVTLPVDWAALAPTLSALAGLVGNARDRADTDGEGAVGLHMGEANAVVPLTPRQADFFDGKPERPELFVEVLYFRTPKAVNIDALKQALSDLCHGHDAFSLRFQHAQAGWIARTDGTLRDTGLECIDVSCASKEELATVRANALNTIRGTISLGDGRLISAVLMDRGADAQGVLAVGFHHLVVDAISLSVCAVRFQEAYENAVHGRSDSNTVQRNTFIPWLRALDEYGRSVELADELDYWKHSCGIDGGAVHVPLLGGSSAWRSVGRKTLAADNNQRILEMFRTPLARSGVVLAALCRAWADVTGDNAPLVMQESHGRHPFPGTDPSTAVGWFAARYPIGVPVGSDNDAMTLIQDATERLSSVPKYGIGYGLLRRRPLGDPLRTAMDRLRKPSILLQYRGNIDETFRTDALFPVIGVFHEVRAQAEAADNLSDVQSLGVVAGLSEGALYWSVFFAPPVSEDMAKVVTEGMENFFREVTSNASLPKSRPPMQS